MIAVVTVLLAFAVGRLLPTRLAAMTCYAVAYLWAFVFQTLYLLLDSLGGADDPAFTAGTFPLSYGLVTLGVLGVGLLLVEAGVRRRVSRSGRSTPSAAGLSRTTS